MRKYNLQAMSDRENQAEFAIEAMRPALEAAAAHQLESKDETKANFERTVERGMFLHNIPFISQRRLYFMNYSMIRACL